jgi:hypothetical protein
MPTTSAGAAVDFFGRLMRVLGPYCELGKNNTRTRVIADPGVISLARPWVQPWVPLADSGAVPDGSDQDPSFEDEGGGSAQSDVAEPSLAVGLEGNAQLVTALDLDADR